MRIQVICDSSAGALTVHAQGYSAATPPARLAATLASAIEAALTEPAPIAQLSPADQQPRPRTPIDPPVDQAPVDQAPVGTAAPAAVQRPTPALPPCPMTAAPAVRPVSAPPAAEVVAAGDSELDGSLRRTALQLLDAGLTDDQVCAQLGISRPRLLRFDDPHGEVLAPAADERAAVTA